MEGMDGLGFKLEWETPAPRDPEYSPFRPDHLLPTRPSSHANPSPPLTVIRTLRPPNPVWSSGSTSTLTSMTYEPIFPTQAGPQCFFDAFSRHVPVTGSQTALRHAHTFLPVIGY